MYLQLALVFNFITRKFPINGKLMTYEVHASTMHTRVISIYELEFISFQMYSFRSGQLIKA